MICALECVERHEWLSEGSGPIPDLEVPIGGEVVTAEVTMHTSSKWQKLWGAAKLRSTERSEQSPERTRPNVKIR